MFSKELVKSTYKLANQKYFEEKYEAQFQSMVDAANRREEGIVFSQNECPFELVKYLIEELRFSVFGNIKEDRWEPIFEVDKFEIENYKEFKVCW